MSATYKHTAETVDYTPAAATSGGTVVVKDGTILGVAAVDIAAAKVGGIYANNTFPAEFIYQNLMMQANVIATSGRAVEAAGDVDVLLLDKTGTITHGNRQASAFLPAPAR